MEVQINYRRKQLDFLVDASAETDVLGETPRPLRYVEKLQGTPYQERIVQANVGNFVCP